jgi:hypothetical protein
VPNQKLFLLNITGHAHEQSYWFTLRKGLEVYVGEGLAPKAMAAIFKRKPG